MDFLKVTSSLTGKPKYIRKDLVLSVNEWVHEGQLKRTPSANATIQYQIEGTQADPKDYTKSVYVGHTTIVVDETAESIIHKLNKD